MWNAKARSAGPCIETITFHKPSGNSLPERVIPEGTLLPTRKQRLAMSIRSGSDRIPNNLQLRILANVYDRAQN